MDFGNPGFPEKTLQTNPFLHHHEKDSARKFTMKILIAGFQHETNTFAPSKADWNSFVEGGGMPSSSGMGASAGGAAGGGGDGGTGITWNGTVYAGGGSGANANNQQNNPGGSPGGGGITNTSPGNVSRAGIDGRGGGGAAGFGGWGAGGPGGAGVFIIRYK